MEVLLEMLSERRQLVVGLPVTYGRVSLHYCEAMLEFIHEPLGLLFMRMHIPSVDVFVLMFMGRRNSHS